MQHVQYIYMLHKTAVDSYYNMEINVIWHRLMYNMYMYDKWKLM